ncbi:MAG: hypothetical protein LBR07_04420, partial [Puniceicoccales bacterium]|nr:hypothetical protein [Puniceicoccales bacterium]
MDYTKITSHLLHSERVIDATDFEFRTWIYLLHYCVEHETGGVLRGAKQWPREKWLAQTGAEYPRFNDVKGNLYGVEGNDVWVAFYP